MKNIAQTYGSEISTGQTKKSLAAGHRTTTQTYQNMPNCRSWQVNMMFLVKICSLLQSGNNFLSVGPSISVFKSIFEYLFPILSWPPKIKPTKTSCQKFIVDNKLVVNLCQIIVVKHTFIFNLSEINIAIPSKRVFFIY
jgi:hypothetical protein